MNVETAGREGAPACLLEGEIRFARGGEVTGGRLCAQRGTGGSDETGWRLGFEGLSALEREQHMHGE